MKRKQILLSAYLQVCVGLDEVTRARVVHEIHDGAGECFVQPRILVAVQNAPQ
jgi:hypothetical protein